MSMRKPKLTLLAGLLAAGSAMAVCPDYTLSSRTYQSSVAASRGRTYVTMREDVKYSLSEGIWQDGPQPHTTNPYSSWIYPAGEVYTQLYQNGVLKSTYPLPGVPVFQPCCVCGDDANAGYRIKLLSQQDPRMEKLDRPVIILQGFDPKHGTGEEFDFDDFVTGLSAVFDHDNPGGAPLSGRQGLLSALYHGGFDVFLVLFKNPVVKIQTNASVFLEALKFVESKSVNLDGREPVIIAPSMGGIVARYGLQKAGQTYGDTYGNASAVHVKALFVYDAPNLGADIPMSLQATLRYLHRKNDDARALLRVVESPSAKQLLMKTVRGRPDEREDHTITNYQDPATEHGKFMAELNNATFRADLKKVANRGYGANCPTQSACPRKPLLFYGITSGGNQGMGQGLVPGTQYAVLRTGAYDSDLRASNAGVLTKAFYGDYWNQNPWNYYLNEPVVLENVPGSFRNSYRTIHNIFERRFSGAYSWNAAFENHSFIPTLSAVGAMSRNVNSPGAYAWGFEPYGSDDMIFDIMMIPDKNQEHAVITLEVKSLMESYFLFSYDDGSGG